MRNLGSLQVCASRLLALTPAVLPHGSTIIVCSTIAPTSVIRIQTLLDQSERGLQLVDAPVSGGPHRSTNGDLAIMASGEPTALSKACSVLQAMSTQAGNARNLHFIREFAITESAKSAQLAALAMAPRSRPSISFSLGSTFALLRKLLPLHARRVWTSEQSSISSLVVPHTAT